ncbi:hypothetical protein [Alcaligenes endophyticus]|uniref:Uncharacterized protein n=1 Tax=Alcaligenes endophyticus TaxID=1929088 RepID=A0ABT8EK91_9BURK|nr:hypothetical protein [Alcaligenes endophyticus]MCX5592017.1 hypothetical protein [Alcaligenes endophyticus]MDN4121707.1 hypothetical protein [Alcaligenes endophyticus]
MTDTIYTLFKDGRMCQTVFGDFKHVIVPTLALWDGESAIGEYDDTYWFYGGTPHKRQPCPAVVDGLWLRGVRPGSTIHIENQSYECVDGGDVELSFQHPGTYQVRVERWPYLDGSYTIENTSQAE